MELYAPQPLSPAGIGPTFPRQSSSRSPDLSTPSRLQLAERCLVLVTLRLLS